MITRSTLAGALLFAFATTACANTTASAPKSTINLVIGAQASSQQEAEDAALLAKGMSAVNANGFPGLAPYLEDLQEALARAPATYPATEMLPNGDIIVRANDESDGMLLMLMASTLGGAGGKSARVIQGVNVYPMLAMLLGSEAVERGAYSDAHRYLDHGLALQPDNWALLSEKAASYLGQRNWSKALDVADAALASNDILLSMHQDAFLRKRGFALVELDRLQEARAAYEQALKLKPDDAGARSEIDYIDGLLAGKAPTGSVMTSPASRPDQLPQ